MEKEIKIYFDKSYLIKTLLSALILLICSLGIVLYKEQYVVIFGLIIQNTFIRNILKTISFLVVIYCSWVMIWVSKKLFKNEFAFIVDKNGFTNKSSIIKTKNFITWSSIQKLEYCEKNEFLVIHLTNGKIINIIMPKAKIEAFKLNLPRQFSKQISENNISIDFNLDY